MPLPLLTAHTHMIARIDAEEALEAATVVVIPHMTDSDRRSQLASWRVAAGGRFVVRPKTRAQLAAIAARHGIKVKVKHR